MVLAVFMFLCISYFCFLADDQCHYLFVKQEVVEPQAEEPPAEEKKKGRGRKRKAKAVPQYNDVSAGFIKLSLSFVIFEFNVFYRWIIRMLHWTYNY
jgi:hypothetical protein